MNQLSIEDYHPKLLYNDYHDKVRLSEELIKQLKECDTFDISVAFIKESGLAVLREILHELREQNKQGRIVTSTYLNFNDPKMFKDLLKYPNITVRIYQGEGFHPKGYIFKKDDNYKIIIGSSNLTQNALTKNQEWNLLLTSKEDQKFIQQINNEFNKQWNQSIPLTQQWIEKYSQIYTPPVYHSIQQQNKIIKPNYMQQSALKSLSKLRKEGRDKALLISATGTGKTYLSAFDVLAYQPQRMLFVVHRRNIAIKAKETFESLIKDKSMGLFSGDIRELDKDYIFATVQTISKQENRELFNRDAFDYIIIDEVHRAGAHSYQELIDYFNPLFLLGMSATPERTDNFDIYKMFDYNIAYEIRLQQAMEYDLLCPFHYYGITDLTIQGRTIDDHSEFNTLISDIRVDYVIEKIEEYGYSGEKVHGLIFVSRKDEAIKLSHLFNQRGYKTKALVGSDSEATRQEAMNQLEANDGDYLDYIFTVDIFNEGIDIPKVNQVVMLRPTQSAIIFVQQLGRGLRKNKEKDYVVIIDFIGNYSQNFFIPIALSGNTNLNKDDLRKFISEGDLSIPGPSTIQFDEISRKRIYQSIDTVNFNTVSMIKQSYQELKAKLGRIPQLMDFEKYGAIDVQKIFQNKSLGSYHEFLYKYEKDYHVEFNDLERQYLKFISNKLSSGKRIQELETIKRSIKKTSNLMNYVYQIVEENYHIQMNDQCAETIKNILTQEFPTGSAKDTYKDVQIIDHNWNTSPTFKRLLNNPEFKKQVLEVIDYAIDIYNRKYSQRYHNTDLCLYEKYTYEDVCRLLNWQQNIVPLNIGGYKYDQHTNTLPVFINYDKEEDITETTKYNDHFIDSQTLIAMSKSNVKLNSKGIEIFSKAKERNTAIHIFIRKNKDDETSKEFYYLGNATIDDIKQDTMANNVPVCEIHYTLDQPVKKEIYEYIIS
ncbi:MAG: DEAD/DEAH box helicase [Erysipelotrichaceae bacterium]|nr:DEAD/DEAH box helicase [Erysipelotrichaceae bacterium]